MAKGITNLRISNDLLTRLQDLMPPHFHGDKRNRLRVETVLAEWIQSQEQKRRRNAKEDAA